MKFYLTGSSGLCTAGGSNLNFEFGGCFSFATTNFYNYFIISENLLSFKDAHFSRLLLG
jgi:hypothetical protein